MAGTKGKANKKGKSKKGRKKEKKGSQNDVMPGLPYGADPWMEAQPIELPESPLGHVRTVFSVGLIMPGTVLDSADMKVQDIRKADIIAAEADEAWENRYKGLEQQLQEVTDTGNRLQDLNHLYESLLNTNQENVDDAMKFLHEAGTKLYDYSQELESQYKKVQAVTNELLRDKDAHHKRMVADYEKQLAEREAILYNLTLEYNDLRKLEEDRDRMQLTIEELRNGIYQNEKQHRRAVMAADERRRRAQRKAQEDVQAALEVMAQQGFMAAKANIARQSEELSEQTAGLAGLFRWLCAEVHKNRDDVQQLTQLLQDCILEQDSVVGACEGRVRELRRTKKQLRTLKQLSANLETDNKVAIKQLTIDTGKVHSCIKESFFNRTQDLSIWKAKNSVMKQEIKKLMRSLRTTSQETNLVERFVVNALVEAQGKARKRSRNEEIQGGKPHETQLMLTWNAEDKRLPLQALQTTRIKAQTQRFSPADIPEHQDISQLEWKEKKLIIETVFKYLKQNHDSQQN